MSQLLENDLVDDFYFRSRLCFQGQGEYYEHKRPFCGSRHFETTDPEIPRIEFFIRLKFPLTSTFKV